MFYQLARYFLFKLDPEVAHELTIKQLSLLGVLRWIYFSAKNSPLARSR